MAFIFDFDGTLADSFATLLGIFEEVSARPQKLTDQEINDLRGKNLRGIIKYLGIKRWQIPRMVMRAKKLITARITKIKPFADIPPVLKQLHGCGHQMFILSTNSASNIARFLETNGLDGYFVKIYGDIGLRSKSSALKKILRKEKINSSDCAYIGDEVRDVEAAKKAGVMSVAVGWGFNYPEAIRSARPSALAQKPQDLLKILK